MSQNKNWNYRGDVNISNGGMFIRIDEREKYAEVVRITDLDSACGFTGAVMIEHLTAFDFSNPKKLENVSNSCGIPLTYSAVMNDFESIVEGFIEYGYFDKDESWDNYREPYIEIVQTIQGEPKVFDGWIATKTVLEDNLKGYIESVHLKY